MNHNYLTSPLTTYDPALQARAAELLNLTASLLGRSRVRAERGSYSILGSSRHGVVAKIIIYDGRRTPALIEDGVYVLTATLAQDADPTIAIGPWWNSRYRYFRLASNQSLEKTATFIATHIDAYEKACMAALDVDLHLEVSTSETVVQPLESSVAEAPNHAPSQGTIGRLARDVVRLLKRVQALASALLRHALELCGVRRTRLYRRQGSPAARAADGSGLPQGSQNLDSCDDR